MEEINVPRREPVIRLAEPGDFEGVRILEDLDFSFHAQARPDCFHTPKTGYTREEYEAILSNPCPIALVADQNGEIVGLCFGFLVDSPGDTLCKARRIAFVQDLVTLPAHRGKGIATALLTRAKQLAVQAGAESMELCVWAFNETARALYEKMGMRVQYYRMETDLRNG